MMVLLSRLQHHYCLLREESILSHRYLHSIFGFKHFSIPFQDTFHLSFAVLVRYRTRIIFKLGGQNPPYSHGITKSRYSGYLT